MKSQKNNSTSTYLEPATKLISTAAELEKTHLVSAFLHRNMRAMQKGANIPLRFFPWLFLLSNDLTVFF